MSRRYLLSLGLALAVIATGCRGSATPPPSATPTPAPTRTLAANPTTPQAGTNTEALCTVVSPILESQPTEESLFPPASEDEWTRGPADAEVTIIEYSDFQ